MGFSSIGPGQWLIIVLIVLFFLISLFFINIINKERKKCKDILYIIDKRATNAIINKIKVSNYINILIIFILLLNLFFSFLALLIAPILSYQATYTYNIANDIFCNLDNLLQEKAIILNSLTATDWLLIIFSAIFPPLTIILLIYYAYCIRNTRQKINQILQTKTIQGE